MAESLQRSEISFRRQGSSGLVWDDKQLINAEFAANSKDAAGDPPEEAAAEREIRPYKTMKEPSPSADPPSPKVSGCGFCGNIFGKSVQQNRHKAKPTRSRR